MKVILSTTLVFAASSLIACGISRESSQTFVQASSADDTVCEFARDQGLLPQQALAFDDNVAKYQALGFPSSIIPGDVPSRDPDTTLLADNKGGANKLEAWQESEKEWWFREALPSPEVYHVVISDNQSAVLTVIGRSEWNCSLFPCLLNHLDPGNEGLIASYAIGGFTDDRQQETHVVTLRLNLQKPSDSETMPKIFETPTKVLDLFERLRASPIHSLGGYGFAALEADFGSVAGVVIEPGYSSSRGVWKLRDRVLDEMAFASNPGASFFTRIRTLWDDSNGSRLAQSVDLRTNKSHGGETATAYVYDGKGRLATIFSHHPLTGAIATIENASVCEAEKRP